jgi:hypothetical protein
MRKGLGVLATLVLVSVVGGVMANPASSQSPKQRTTISVFDPNKTDYEKVVNTGKKGFSPGDVGLSIEKLLDPETCEPAGRLIARFQIVKLVGEDNADFILDLTYIREDGRIAGYFAGNFNQFEEGLAITGGTDAYRDASGEMNIDEQEEACEKKGAILTFDYVLSG